MTIPVEQFLKTSYEPHCEYLDGIVVPKALPDMVHSIVHSEPLHELRPPLIVEIPVPNRGTLTINFDEIYCKLPRARADIVPAQSSGA